MCCLARFVFLGAKFRKRLAAVGDLHQLGCAAGADADLDLEQRLPLGPVAGVLLLERREMLAGGNVVVLALLGGLSALGDVRLDRADERRLRRRGRGVIGGGDRTAKLIIAPGLQAATCKAHFFEAHYAAADPPPMRLRSCASITMSPQAGRPLGSLSGGGSLPVLVHLWAVRGVTPSPFAM